MAVGTLDSGAPLVGCALSARAGVLADRLRRAKARLRGGSVAFPPQVEAHVIHVWFDGTRFEVYNESLDQSLVFTRGWGSGQRESLPSFLLFLTDQLSGTLVDTWASDKFIGGVAGLVLVPNI